MAVTGRSGRTALALGVVAVIAWLMSYSWLLGAVIPVPEIEYAVSPWLVSEIVAVLVGLAAVVVALVGARGMTGMRRRARVGAVMGGVAATLAMLSLAAQ
jgi:hypothetical protein